MEAQRAICTSKWRSGGPFRPQDGGLGGRPKKFRKTVKLSTRVHNLQLDIGVSTRPNVDKTKRAWVANSSQDVRSEGGEPSSNCMSIFLNIQTSIGRRGSAGVAKRLELSLRSVPPLFCHETRGILSVGCDVSEVMCARRWWWWTWEWEWRMWRRKR